MDKNGFRIRGIAKDALVRPESKGGGLISLACLTLDDEPYPYERETLM